VRLGGLSCKNLLKGDTQQQTKKQFAMPTKCEYFKTSLEAATDIGWLDRRFKCLPNNAQKVELFADIFFTCTEITTPYPEHWFVKNKKTGQIGMAFCVRADTPDGWLTAIAYADGVDLLGTSMFMPYKGNSTPERLGAMFGTLVATDETFMPPTCPCCCNRDRKATTSD